MYLYLLTMSIVEPRLHCRSSGSGGALPVRILLHVDDERPHVVSVLFVVGGVASVAARKLFAQPTATEGNLFVPKADFHQKDTAPPQKSDHSPSGL